MGGSDYQPVPPADWSLPRGVRRPSAERGVIEGPLVPDAYTGRHSLSGREGGEGGRGETREGERTAMSSWLTMSYISRLRSRIVAAFPTSSMNCFLST
eukprot:COSAG03_NODE_3125_length_2197_cov_3.789323_2_plen_98_part_00